MFSISSTTGASVSVTITSKLQKLVLPAASVAVKLTVVVPTGNVSPEAGPLVWRIVAPSALSVNSGIVKSTTAPQTPGSLLRSIFSGQVISGPSVSFTVIVTVAVSVPPFPSEILYSKVSTPVKLSLGVYVTVPLVLITTSPFSGVVVSVTTRSPPSMSESLSRTETVTALSWSVIAASFTAIGSSLTGFTVIVTVAVSVKPSSSLIV